MIEEVGQPTNNIDDNPTRCYERVQRLTHKNVTIVVVLHSFLNTFCFFLQTTIAYWVSYSEWKN